MVTVVSTVMLGCTLAHLNTSSWSYTNYTDAFLHPKQATSCRSSRALDKHGKAPHLFDSCMHDRTKCWDGSTCTAECWRNMWVQFAVGIILLLGATALHWWANLKDQQQARARQEARHRYHVGRVCKRRDWSRARWGAVRIEKTYRWRQTASTTLAHIREEGNFIKDNVDPTLILPPMAGPEVVVLPLVRHKQMLALFRATPVVVETISALGLAVLSGGIATLFWLRYSYAEHIGNTAMANKLNAYAVAADKVYGDFVFFPMFLLVGELGYIVNKYRNWLVVCHSIQGQIAGVSAAVGGAVVNPDDLETRKALFRIYRYLTMSHFLCYKDVQQEFAEMTPADIVLRGLITTAESETLLPTRNVQRETMIVWIIAEIHEMRRKGQIDMPSKLSACLVCFFFFFFFFFRLLPSRDNPRTIFDLLVCVYPSFVFTDPC